jgi:hypothetical protein
MKKFINILPIHSMAGRNMEKRHYVPTNDDYKKTIARLTDEKKLDTLVAVRMGCELGISRLELANARVSDLDRINKRGLWIELAKGVRSGRKKGWGGKFHPNFEMRQREIPVNTGLYQLLITYIDRSQVYILKRHKGDINKPFSVRYINTLYEDANIPWSSHRSRHYFKNRVKDWMRANRQMDDELIKDYLGHKKNTTELYGSLSWDYKLSTIDLIFE